MYTKPPGGYRIIGWFLLLSILILSVAGITLLFPGTFWSQVWFFKKREYQQLLAWRMLAGFGFWTLAIIMTFAAIGWLRRLRWGWLLTMGIFVVNGLSDAVRLITGDYMEGGIGVTITTGIILLFSEIQKYPAEVIPINIRNRLELSFIR